MYTRLAFSVAAHLEPEILIVDEVLAVGDAAFQKKCLGQMTQVARSGRTVLFVSHNMGAVSRLCTDGMFMQDGRLVAKGPIEAIISRYLSDSLSSNAEVRYEAKADMAAQIRHVRLLNAGGLPSAELDRRQAFSVEIEYDVRRSIEGAQISYMLERADGTPVCYSADIDARPDLATSRSTGSFRATVSFPGDLLNAGVFQIRLGIARRGGTIFDYRELLRLRAHRC